MYHTIYSDERVALTPDELNDVHSREEIDNKLLQKLIDLHSSKCNANGYVKPNSIELVARSAGAAENGRFTGNYVYDCKRGHGFENCIEDIDMVNKETSANFTYLKYTKHMNLANDPVMQNNNRSRSNSFSLKTISKESDEIIEAVRRSNSITSTNSELSFPSRANSIDYT